jgi:hypothetical protein
MTDTPTEAWIKHAQDMLEQLDPADPRFAAGFAEWRRRVREYDDWTETQEAERAVAQAA